MKILKKSKSAAYRKNGGKCGGRKKTRRRYKRKSRRKSKRKRRKGRSKKRGGAGEWRAIHNLEKRVKQIENRLHRPTGGTPSGRTAERETARFFGTPGTPHSWGTTTSQRTPGAAGQRTPGAGAPRTPGATARTLFD